MDKTKVKDDAKRPELPLTNERLARIVNAEKKTFNGKGQEVRK